MPRRIDAGDVLAALGGVLLLIALFLDWFAGATAWQAFELVDLLLAAGALAAIAAAAEGLGLRSGLRPRALVPIGLALLAIVVVQLIEPPPSFSNNDDLGSGAWLGLAGAVLILLGAALRVAKINVTVSVGGRETRRRVPAVDRRPAAGGADARPFDAAETSVRAGSSAPSGGSAAAGAAGRAPFGADEDLDDPQTTQPFRPVEEP